MHYNVNFDQHDIITAIHFEGGYTITMHDEVRVDENTYEITGVRDIIKMVTEPCEPTFYHPFDLEVRFDVVKK